MISILFVKKLFYSIVTFQAIYSNSTPLMQLIAIPPTPIRLCSHKYLHLNAPRIIENMLLHAFINKKIRHSNTYTYISAYVFTGKHSRQH